MEDLTKLTESERRRDLTPTSYVALHRAEQISNLKQPAYNHDTVRGVWIWGEPGTGKTHYAREKYPNCYIKAQNKWWDGYTG